MIGHNGIAIAPDPAAPAPKRVRMSDMGRTAGAETRSQQAAPRRTIAVGDLLWRRRSVRAQLLITILLIDLIAALAACGVIIFQTRMSVQVEVASSMKLADLLVQESIQMQQDVAAERILPNLP